MRLAVALIAGWLAGPAMLPGAEAGHETLAGAGHRRRRPPPTVSRQDLLRQRRADSPIAALPTGTGCWLEVASRTLPLHRAMLASSTAPVVVVPGDALDRRTVAELRAAGKVVLARLSLGRVRRSDPWWPLLDARQLDLRRETGPSEAARDASFTRRSGTLDECYALRYDRPAWRDLVTRSAARLGQIGCDGLVLADLEPSPRFPMWSTARPMMELLMVQVIDRFREHLPRAPIVIDGASSWFDEPRLRARVAAWITSGIWYRDGRRRRLPDPVSRARLAECRRWRQRGILVAVRDALIDAPQVATVRRLAAEAGLVVLLPWW